MRESIYTFCNLTGWEEKDIEYNNPFLQDLTAFTNVINLNGSSPLPFPSVSISFLPPPPPYLLILGPSSCPNLRLTFDLRGHIDGYFINVIHNDSRKL